MNEILANLGASIKVSRYAVLDMDGDQTPELVLELTQGGYPIFLEVLRYTNGVVYGYLQGARGLNELKEDGNFKWANSAFNTGYGKLTFESDRATTNIVGYRDVSLDGKGVSTETYFIDNKPVSKEAYIVFSEREDGKRSAAWLEFSQDKSANSMVEANNSSIDIPAPATPKFTSLPLSTPRPTILPPSLTITAGNNTLQEIMDVLRKQKGVFHITESPDKKYIAFMYSVTNSLYDDMTLYIWRTGNIGPKAAINKVDHVGAILWSPTSDYLLVDMGTYVLRYGALFSVGDVREVTTLNYFHIPFFSPDGRNLVYSAASEEKKMDTVKGHYLDPGEAFDLKLFNIASTSSAFINKGNETTDYSAIGWLDSNTISYDKVSYSVQDNEMIDESVKYKYDIRSKMSLTDGDHKFTTDDYWKVSRPLYEQMKTDVFGITWSPDHRSVVYGKGEKEVWGGDIWFWKIGENKPILIQSMQLLDKIVWSNDSRYFMFNSGISYTESVRVVNAQNNKMYTISKFGSMPLFSPTSVYVLFTESVNLNSPYLKETETGYSHYVSVLNLKTEVIETITKPSSSVEYIALGWLGDRRLMYKKIDNEKKTEEIVEMDLQR